MIEYLNPKDWSLHVIDGENDGVHSDWILVPEGAVIAIYLYSNDEIAFYDKYCRAFYDDGSGWQDIGWTMIELKDDRAIFDGNDISHKVLWQRKTTDNVNNPTHYNKGGIECIDAIKSSMSQESFNGYLKGNIQKYMWRYEDKGGIESLQKAQWYLNKLIDEVK